MEFQNYLKNNAQQIEKKLEKILSDFLNDTKQTNLALLPFAKEFIKSCKGGKRIRGVLVKLGYEVGRFDYSLPSTVEVRSRKSEDILKISAAFEILHTSLLIHDDIIDQSPKRRGIPSLFKALGGNHYGISQAITLGDIGLYLPLKIILETRFEDKYKLKALKHFSQILINTGWGQVMDVSPKSRDKAFIDLYKTAKYTISGPMQIGAILAGADDKLIKNLSEFGDNLGIAFQIKDDILDLEGGSIKEAEKYASKAKKMIRDITKDQKITEVLESMTEYVVGRTN